MPLLLQGVALFALAHSRALQIVPLSACVNVTRPKAERIPKEQQFMLWWSGLRGGVAFALSVSAGSKYGKDGKFMETATFLICALTVVINGGASPWLLQRLQLLRSQQKDIMDIRPAGKASPRLCLACPAVHLFHPAVWSTESCTLQPVPCYSAPAVGVMLGVMLGVMHALGGCGPLFVRLSQVACSRHPLEAPCVLHRPAARTAADTSQHRPADPCQHAAARRPCRSAPRSAAECRCSQATAWRGCPGCWSRSTPI
jgi:hypothetical protein